MIYMIIFLNKIKKIKIIITHVKKVKKIKILIYMKIRIWIKKNNDLSDSDDDSFDVNNISW